MDSHRTALDPTFAVGRFFSYVAVGVLHLGAFASGLSATQAGPVLSAPQAGSRSPVESPPLLTMLEPALYYPTLDDLIDAAPPASGAMPAAIVGGHEVSGDGGGGTFVWDPQSQETHDVGLFVEPALAVPGASGRWTRVRSNPGEVSVLWFGARRDGSDAPETTAALQAALDSVGAGKACVVHIPKGRYLVDAPLNLPNVGVRLVGDGLPNTSGVGGTGLLAVCKIGALLDIGGTHPSDLFLERLELDGGGKADSVLRLTRGLTQRSRISDLSLKRAAAGGKGFEVAGSMIGVLVDNLNVSGGAYGVWAGEDAVLNASTFRHLRISNTQSAAFYVRNSGPGLRSFTMSDPTIEGNRGPAIDARGGMNLRMFGGWFEQNNTDSPIDRGTIELGRFPTQSTLCQISLHGTHFGHPGDSSQVGMRPRLRALESHTRIYLNSVYMPKCSRILYDPVSESMTGGTTAGARIWGVMLTNGDPDVEGLAITSQEFFPSAPCN